ncbi:iron deficiency-induced protein a [Leptolyngbya sp. Heron Island J]|uniref:Fe(3+) ABC transporter substrate-binding protein n=1 Tax=Leptolyngbya sp. Heron Island J TaxID=1385935 RepID=UPI0003B97620|nr:Fe(3+) ABC transporter substrate-binding protein [Leptolyngbya sp. Heron Island J]ESA32723.1 iron deficiency-induced protein a [Leptolyngbya sp. Heron Island J]
MKFSRRSLLISGVGSTAAFAATQVFAPKRGMAQTGEINLYSSRHYNTDDKLYQQFTEQTGIRVNLLEGNADELLERLKAEGDRSPADVFMTVDAGRLWRADQEGVFAPVSSSALDERIPESLRHPDGHWFGVSKRARVLMYNKDLIESSMLSTYEALADASLRGKVLTRSSSNIYSQSLTASMISIHGAADTEEWAAGLVANFARQPEGNDRAQIEAAAAGIGGVAIANTYYLPRYAKDEDPAKQEIFKKIGVFFPNQGDDERGTHVNISGAGVVKSAPNRDNAVKFLEFLASDNAQAFFAQGNNEYPVVEGIPIDPVVGEFGTFKADTLNVNQLGENQAEAVRIMDRVGWV